jgi:hypothetical protein
MLDIARCATNVSAAVASAAAPTKKAKAKEWTRAGASVLGMLDGRSVRSRFWRALGVVEKRCLVAFVWA